MKDLLRSVRLASSTMGADTHVRTFFRSREEVSSVLLPFIVEGIEQLMWAIVHTAILNKQILAASGEIRPFP